MNLQEWLIWFSFIPNGISYFYMLCYTLYDPPDKKNISKFKLSLITTSINLFVVPCILALPQIYDKNFLYKDFFVECQISYINIIPEIFVKSFIGSLVFYILHRISHLSYFYEKIHKHHHNYVIVEPVSAFDVSLLEFILVYMPAGLISHQITPYIFYGKFCLPFTSDLISRILEMLLSMHIHVKKVHKYDILKYWIFFDVEIHRIHHKKLNCNYGAPNNFLPDLIFGTYKK